MHRRDFLKNLSALPAAGMLPAVINLFDVNSPVTIKPPRLKPGDTIGLVAPGSYISEKELETCKSNIQGLGFDLLFSERVLNRTGYLAGSDSARADELNGMFKDNKVKGIICARGGYGCSRILPLLNFGLIKDNPKVLMGYSDITALINGIYSKTGLITFHGPVGISTFNNFSKMYLDDILINPVDKLVLSNDKKDMPGIIPIRGGKVQGKLAGGNLATLISLLGTPYDIDYTGKIIFLEEIEEEPYRIDRMLTQLIEADKLTKAAGIAMGVFDKCEPEENGSSFDLSFSLMEVLYDRLFNLGIPVIYGLSFGHIVNKFTLPVGIIAELDVDNQKITLLEPAVI